jgi:hypothetical protein
LEKGWHKDTKVETEGTARRLLTEPITWEERPQRQKGLSQGTGTVAMPDKYLSWPVSLQSC